MTDSVVKEEICDEDTKLPYVNGRAICWLIQIEGSLAGSDSRSQSSLNLNEFNTKPVQSNEGNLVESKAQFSSMHSVSSNGSSLSNNENFDRNNVNNNRNSSNKLSGGGGGQQIYDTLNNRKSNKQRPLK